MAALENLDIIRMWSFIFEIAVFAGLAGILVLVLRVLPRVSNEVFIESRSLIRTHELTLMIERADEVLKAWFEKFLRRLKVFILRADNVVTEKIAKVTDDRTKEKASFVVSLPEGEDEEDRVAITEEGLPARSQKAEAGKSPDSREARLVSVAGGEGTEEPPMEIQKMSKKHSSAQGSGGAKRGRKKVSL